jgi:hypothetical protein
MIPKRTAGSDDRRPMLDPDQCNGGIEVHPFAMARSDWNYTLCFAATLALTIGAICILLFAM